MLVEDIYGNLWRDFTEKSYNEFTRKGVPLRKLDYATGNWIPNKWW